MIDGASGSCGKVIGEIVTDKSIKISAAITNNGPNAGHTFVDEKGNKMVFIISLFHQLIWLRNYILDPVPQLTQKFLQMNMKDLIRLSGFEKFMFMKEFH